MYRQKEETTRNVWVWQNIDIDFNDYKTYRMKSFALVVCLLAVVLLFSCSKSPSEKQLEAWKQEVLRAEKAFEAKVKEKGIGEGFLQYASNEAVLLRGESLIQGRDELEVYFKMNAEKNQGVKLLWDVDFVDVSKSGDMAYTYGTYHFSIPDSTGMSTDKSGIFHTVWKRDSDGNWKFVWD